jgi:hypothetical protein
MVVKYGFFFEGLVKITGVSKCVHKEIFGPREHRHLVKCNALRDVVRCKDVRNKD